jgi:hypothetical protein
MCDLPAPSSASCSAAFWAVMSANIPLSCPGVALILRFKSIVAAMPNIRLYPGMPATVMIPTIQRTAFDYIVGPLVMSFNHSFRQK